MSKENYLKNLDTENAIIDRKVLRCLVWYVNQVATTTRYESWSDEYCRDQNKKHMDNMLDVLKQHIDFDNLTADQAWQLGFCLWDSDQPDLFLIPLYLLPIIPIGTKLTSINDREVIYDGTNIDDDIRFGCIAYGIHVKTDSKEDEQNV